MNRTSSPSNNQNPIPPIPRRLACSETWASNRRTASLVELPGLTAWVYSAPAGRDPAGGDVHYLSVCQVASSRASRLPMSADSDRPSRCSARGSERPPPLWHRASRGAWSWLETNRHSEREQPVGLPLDLFDDITYDRLVLKPRAGDFLLLFIFSDAVCESKSPAGIELGRDGLIDMVRTLASSAPESLGTQLASALCAFRGNTELGDDETIMILKGTIPDGAQPKFVGGEATEEEAGSMTRGERSFSVMQTAGTMHTKSPNTHITAPAKICSCSGVIPKREGASLYEG